MSDQKTENQLRAERIAERVAFARDSDILERLAEITVLPDHRIAVSPVYLIGAIGELLDERAVLIRERTALQASLAANDSVAAVGSDEVDAVFDNALGAYMEAYNLRLDEHLDELSALKNARIDFEAKILDEHLDALHEFATRLAVRATATAEEAS